MECFARWSGCGRFVLVAYHLDPYAPFLTLQGFVWNAVAGQIVFGWQSGAGCSTDIGIGEDPVVWDVCCRSCHVPSCNSIVALPWEQGDVAVRHFPLVTSGCAALCLGGKIALSCMQMHEASMNCSSEPRPLTWQLFHSEIDIASGTCKKHLMANGDGICGALPGTLVLGIATFMPS